MKKSLLLLDILKEMYVDRQGNLVGEADFVILEGGFRGGIYKNIENINVDDYINFTTKLSSFKEKNIANSIYNQILQIYNQSSLKRYNEIIGFTPELQYNRGGSAAASEYNIYLTNNLFIRGILNPTYYMPETGFDEYIKKMRGALGIKDDETDSKKLLNKDKDLSRFKDFDKQDLQDKIINLSVICIPKYQFDGSVISQIDVDISTGNKSFGHKHEPYSKQDLLNDLNEVGLFLLSENKKSKDVDLSKTDFTLYIIKPDAIKTGYRKVDGTSYRLQHNTPFIIFCKDNENWKDVLGKYHPSSYNDPYDLLYPSVYVFGGEVPTETKEGTRIVTVEPNPPKVLKYKNTNISREEFNKLKKLQVYQPREGGDRYLKEKFPELLNKLPERN